jgi:hypothetical protein
MYVCMYACMHACMCVCINKYMVQLHLFGLGFRV